VSGGCLRLAVYTDYTYRRAGGVVSADRAFALFVCELSDWFDRLVLVGRLHPGEGRFPYQVPPGVDFAALPHYASLARPLGAIREMRRSLRRFSRVLDDVDGVWLLGPHPMSLAFAVLAALRRRRVVLGVRQDLPNYARSRHPGRRRFYFGALLLEYAYRALARRFPVVVVGPDLARRYRHAGRVLPITVSLIRASDIVVRDAAPVRDYGGDLQILSVGRLDMEKNPLLLADVLARLRARDRRWRLVICGEGPMRAELTERLEELGVAEQTVLRGYVPIDQGLLDLYRESHVLLHVSWTEGVPQVLFEAFGTDLPVVATAVGGVADAVGDAARLVAPGDAEAVVEAVKLVASDVGTRRALVDAGRRRVGAHTLEAEARRVAAFIQGRAGDQD
jgi:glycosyltransferase involved in cell wall biosynthesis